MISHPAVSGVTLIKALAHVPHLRYIIVEVNRRSR